MTADAIGNFGSCLDPAFVHSCRIFFLFNRLLQANIVYLLLTASLKKNKGLPNLSKVPDSQSSPTIMQATCYLMTARYGKTNYCYCRYVMRAVSFFCCGNLLLPLASIQTASRS